MRGFAGGGRALADALGIQLMLLPDGGGEKGIIENDRRLGDLQAKVAATVWDQNRLGLIPPRSVAVASSPAANHGSAQQG